MEKIKVGIITKVTSSKVNISVTNKKLIGDKNNDLGILSFFSIGSYLQTYLPNNDIIILRCEEILDVEDMIIVATYVGVADEIIGKFSEGITKFPIIDEPVFTAQKNVIDLTLKTKNQDVIGTYLYDESIKITYDSNILFGKHLGVFGNTGTGKTCTVVSIIQNYIRTNPLKNIKFIILDVNGEYRNAFTNVEADYIEYKDIRLHHSILSNAEYGKLFKASEGIQYPALQACIHDLGKKWEIADLNQKLDEWVQEKSQGNMFNENQLYGYLRTMKLRIDTILADLDLCSIIDSNIEIEGTLEKIKKTSSKVSIINLNVSNDSLDIILFLLFKSIYLSKVINKDFNSHLVLVLEEAHRYINSDSDSTRLGNFFIDKLAREGRKFGLGLIVSSQVPSMLSYSIVSQCNSVIMHKITNKRDNEYLRGVLRMSSDIFFDQMNTLPKQYAIVCGEAFTNDVIVKILDANPLPDSSDPIIN